MTGSSYKIILCVVALSGPATAQEIPSVEPTPEQYVETVESVQRMGMALYVKFHVAQEASALIADEYGEDPAVAGWLVDLRREGPRVRFLGGDGENVRVLYQVQYAGQQPGPPEHFDPPAALEPGEDALWAAKLAALEVGKVCPDIDYVAILAPLQMASQPGIEAYVLANSTPRRAHLGGHARVRIAYDGVSVQEVEPLSNTCLTIEPEPGQEPELLVGTHILTSTPIAAHVFLSMQLRKPLLVTTDAGAWVVAGPQIAYTGLMEPTERGEDAPLRKAWMTAPGEDWQPEGADGSPPPPWRERLIVWRASDDLATPWRDDERFRGQFEPGYPDDLMVVFPPESDTGRGEVMFVRVFAHHPESDRFLGMLLNQPRWLGGLFAGDNVEFSHEPEIGRPVARSRAGAYEAVSLPPSASDGELAELYEGIRHYRSGMMGGDRSAAQIDACIDTLGGIVSSRLTELDEHHRYLTHYTLGRCLAESYETDRAIEQFEAARDLRPDALDPNMALLAELSLKVHDPEGGASGSWDEAFIQQLERVRELPIADSLAAQTLEGIFDEALVAQTREPLSDAEIERRRKVGFAVFRWKVP